MAREKPPESLITCATCNGTGWILKQQAVPIVCPECRGRGVAAWWGSRWWSWLHPLDESSIWERHAEHTIRAMINGLLMLFALTGMWFGVRAIGAALGEARVFDIFFTRSWPMAAFWLGMLCVMYIIFRLERDLNSAATIPIDTMAAQSGDPWENPADIFSVSTEETIRTLEKSWRIAQHYRQPAVTPAHLLQALVSLPAVTNMLVRLAVNPEELEERLAHLNTTVDGPRTSPVLSSPVRWLLAEALARAAVDGQTRITPTYLLAPIGSLSDPARDLLDELGIDDRAFRRLTSWLNVQEELRRRIHHYQTRAAMKPKGVIDRGYTAIATPILNRFSTDLTAAARSGQLPYIVGRQDELKAIFRAFVSSRHSVILVGDQGVGKTSLLYALAQRMVAEDVPESIQDKRLVSLSASALVAGAGATGQIEERVESIINEIVRAGNIVLAIENYDQLVGAASTGGQGLDAAGIFSQALQNRLFMAIATANIQDYRRHLEHGPAATTLERVDVEEMDDEEAIGVLQSHVGPLEHKHRVFFSVAALDRAVTLTERYLPEQTLPGKALDAIEEAAVLAARERGHDTLVSGEDVARVISQRTNIVVTEITTDERQKLIDLEEIMHQRVVGQNEAVQAVANAMRRARAELRDATRPIANLLFLGPTGVGKTETAKTLAATYFGSEEAMIRLDMSEYQDVGSINRLIGAPPGYSGGQSGYLTAAVRAKPFSLVLLDELEKAHPDILNVFLQVMDDGRLTDSDGRTVNMTNIILIATSNAGTQHIQDRLQQNASMETIKQELLNDVLPQHFRPEFLNRFDSIVVFLPLNPAEIEQIVGLMIKHIATGLAEKGIVFRTSPEAIAQIARDGFDPLYGARPLRRMVQERVDNALAQYMLQGQLGRRDVAILEADGKIRVEKAVPVGK